MGNRTHDPLSQPNSKKSPSRTTFRMAITFSNNKLYSICGYDLNRE
jgi:hypothetical protein